MSAPLDPAQARDISIAALLRVVLHECAQAPLTLLTADPEPAVIRIARGGEQREQAFAETLVQAYESASEMLLARTTKLTRSRADADDIVQTAFMRVYARRASCSRPPTMAPVSTVPGVPALSWIDTRGGGSRWFR